MTKKVFFSLTYNDVKNYCMTAIHSEKFNYRIVSQFQFLNVL